MNDELRAELEQIITDALEGRTTVPELCLMLYARIATSLYADYGGAETVRLVQRAELHRRDLERERMRVGTALGHTLADKSILSGVGGPHPRRAQVEAEVKALREAQTVLKWRLETAQGQLYEVLALLPDPRPMIDQRAVSSEGVIPQASSEPDNG